MKRLFALVVVVLSSLAFVRAPQRPDYRVVFDLTTRDTLDQKATLRWVNEVSSASKDAQIEVVMYGKGFELVTRQSLYAAQVRKALENPNVKFKVCEVALKNNGVDKSQLIDGVETTPDGIYEIMAKQRAQWGYIKVVAH